MDNGNKIMEACVFDGETDLNPDTPIYQYMAIEKFLYFLKYRQITFSKLSSWPDAREGARFEFIREIHDDEKYSQKTINHFLGSSWTLQIENQCKYSSKDERQKAEEEIQKHGSASMWETYCRQGGVRIKTTIKKLENLVSGQHNNYQFYRGVAHYAPENYWSKTLSTSGLISKLFIKRVPFRHESEYRFILDSENEIQVDHIFFDINNLYDFVDEFLIAPATSKDIWISRMLYHYAVSITNSPEINGTNQKTDMKYCRISQLYGNISHEI
ncbi:MAG: hypothetical protein U9Q58_08105 [Pseudomonadota bacterium]|nr:hypothetical protein [Pseudomonadota bacterium]